MQKKPALNNTGNLGYKTKDKSAVLVIFLNISVIKCLRTAQKTDIGYNAHIHETLGMTKTIEDVVVSERKMQWFGHVVRNKEWINAAYKQDFSG